LKDAHYLVLVEELLPLLGSEWVACAVVVKPDFEKLLCIHSQPPMANDLRVLSVTANNGGTVKEC